MIRFRIFGNPVTLNAPQRAKIVPYGQIQTSVDITVGVAVTAINGGLSTKDSLLFYRNISTAGQTIRIGGDLITFAATPSGKILYPGEEFRVDFYDAAAGTAHFIVNSAIADIAGATLNILTISSAV